MRCLTGRAHICHPRSGLDGDDETITSRDRRHQAQISDCFQVLVWSILSNYYNLTSIGRFK